MNLISKFVFTAILLARLFSQSNIIDGVAVIVDESIILKSEVGELLQMSMMQRNLAPTIESDEAKKIENEIIDNLSYQKLALKSAEVESLIVNENEVDLALNQHLSSIITQYGSEEAVESLLGKPFNQLRRDMWYDMRDQLISERYRDQLLKNVVVSRKEVVDFYNQRMNELGDLPTQYNISHILFKLTSGEKSKDSALEKIRSIRNQIILGASFSDMAIQYSDDPGSSNSGGELGFMGRGAMFPEFEKAAFLLEPNEISDIVETRIGFHIIKVVGKRGETINAGHILIMPQVSEEDENKVYRFASTISDSITDPRSFALFAKKYSGDEKTKGSGGKLGWVDEKSLPIPEFKVALHQLNLNEVSLPIKTAYGYHLLLLNNKKDGGTPSLKNHWLEIKEWALTNKKLEKLSKWYQESLDHYYYKNYIEQL